jgi:hypothetical protein
MAPEQRGQPAACALAAAEFRAGIPSSSHRSS